MEDATTRQPHGTPKGNLYDPPMTRTQRMSVENARAKLGRLLDAAGNEGVHTIVSKHGEPAAVLVPIGWYRNARNILGDPTDL